MSAWAARHRDRLLIVALALALAMVGGYQLYAWRVSDRNAKTATRVDRLSAAACAQTQFLYDLLNALAIDASPRFGSPPDGPVIVGARDALIRRLFAAERSTAAPLRRQGCAVKVPQG